MVATRDVNYGLRHVGQMPAKAIRGSVVKDTVAELKRRVNEGEMESGERSASILADYLNRTAAAAQLNMLRKNYGYAEASGLSGVVVTDTDDNSPTVGRHLLVVSYDPSLVTDAGKAAHAEAFAKHQAHVKENADRKKAEKAAAAPAKPPKAGK